MVRSGIWILLVDVPLTSANAWSCRKESDWIHASSGAGTVIARAQVRVTTPRQRSDR